MKKDQGKIQANLADHSNKECFKFGKTRHAARKCKSPATCAACGGEHPTARHDAVMKFAESRGDEEQKEQVKFKDKDND